MTKSKKALANWAISFSTEPIFQKASQNCFEEWWFQTFSIIIPLSKPQENSGDELPLIKRNLLQELAKLIKWFECSLKQFEAKEVQVQNWGYAHLEANFRLTLKVNNLNSCTRRDYHL